MAEHTIQRNLTYATFASLALTPFIGALGLIGAATLIASKFLRLTYNNKAAENYDKEQEERGKIKRQERDKLLQRQEQERESQRTHQIELYDTVLERISEYLSNLSQEEYDKVKEIKVDFPGQRTFLGIPFGRKRSLEYKIIKE